MQGQFFSDLLSQKCEQVMSVTGWYLFGNTFIGVIKKAIALTLSI
ncbi:hypothetical protein [Nostoc sp. CHAB 5836]|nr:hypothetical protein [Nostoc sp. CHAB 5836]